MGGGYVVLQLYCAGVFYVELIPARMIIVLLHIAADTNNNVIRHIWPDLSITTIAGNTSGGIYYGDGVLAVYSA